MGRWPTYTDLARGPVSVGVLAQAFQDALVGRLLEAVWETYDTLLADEYSFVADWNTDLRDLERSLTQEFELVLSEHVRRLNKGYLPVLVQHGRFEHQSQASNVGQPPAYDIAFVWAHDPRIVWPIEAKALRDDLDTDVGPGEYVQNGVRRYLNRTYAPFVFSGAMLAYLRSGSPSAVALRVGSRLGVRLRPYAAFSEREHWTSDHTRPRADGAGTEPFVCHHLVLKLDR